MPPCRAELRRAFSVLEVVIALTMTIALLAAVSPRLSSGQRFIDDSQAATTLDAAIGAVTERRNDLGKLVADCVLTPAAATAANAECTAPAVAGTQPNILTYLPEIEFLDGNTEPADVQQTSMATTAAQVGLATVAGDGSCAYLLRTFVVTEAGAGPNQSMLYGIRAPRATTLCTGAVALTLEQLLSAQPGRGAHWTKPLMVPAP